MKLFQLYFVCPVAMKTADTCDGKGYTIKRTKQWVKDCAPAIKAGLMILKIGIIAGKIYGLPIPNLSELSLSSNQEEFILSLIKHLDEEIDSNARADIELIVTNQSPNNAQTKKLVGDSYRSLKSSIMEQDPNLLSTGLIRTRARDGI